MAPRPGRLEALAILVLLFVAWLCACALLRRRGARFQKGTPPMTDLPIATRPTGAAAAPPSLEGAQVVTSVVEAVQTHPDVPPDRAASVIASILAGLAQAQPAIFAASRSGARTQAQVSLGLGLAEVIVGAFLQSKG